MLTVGDLFGLKDGDNPHRWYDPADVEAVANAITADLKKLDPKARVLLRPPAPCVRDPGSRVLPRADRSRSSAATRGTPVGASESIFALQAPALGLKLITPYSFMKAISEGTEVTAQDTLTTQRQLRDGEVKVWIYNSQNATPAIQHLNALARARAHPDRDDHRDALTPAGASFRAVAGGAAAADRAGAACQPPGDDVVELRGAEVRLGGRPIFGDVDLTVGRGEFLAVLGPNGAGKSTLMRAILGLVPLAAGSVTVLGGSPAHARPRIGYLPQRRGFDRATRLRGVDLVRLGVDGARWGVPVPLSPAARDPPARRARSRRDR